jgi:hypothetical protein
MTSHEQRAINAVHAARLAAVHLKSAMLNADLWLNTAIGHAGKNYDHGSWVRYHCDSTLAPVNALVAAIADVQAELAELHAERRAAATAEVAND